MKTILLATLTAVAVGGLSACGGGNQAAPISPPAVATLPPSPVGTVLERQMKVSGRVLNIGYVSHAKVCFDRNDDNQCNDGEPTTWSDAAGRYALSVPSDLRGTHLLAVLDASSVDTAFPAEGGSLFGAGWVWSSVLEYPVGVSDAKLNITALSSTYLMRLMGSGRNRLSSKNAVLMRSGQTSDYSLAADFDYVASPVAGLPSKLRGLSDYLAARTKAAGGSGSLLDTAAVLSAWYGTYNVSTSPQMDVSKFTAATATTIATSLDTYSYRYFHTQSSATTALREGVVDSGGFTRDGNSIQVLTSQGTKLANGSVWQYYMQWSKGVWTNVAYPDAEYVTLDQAGQPRLFAGNDALQARSITAVDGNTLTYQLPVNGVRFQLEIASDALTNWHISDWYGPQLSETTYGITTPLTVKPTTCGAIAANQTTATLWFSACRKYFMDEHIAAKGGLKAVQDPAGKSYFYDVTLQDNWFKWPLAHPLNANCTGRKTITLAGKNSCNWSNTAVSNTAGLFDANGVSIESWAKTDSAGQPRLLTLKLASDGTGTLKGIAATTVASYATADVTEVTEEIRWSRSTANAEVILLDFKPQDSTQIKRALPDHFKLGDFALTPSAPETPNFRRLALVVQDHTLLAGQFYGVGYISSERYLNPRALDVSIAALNQVINKLYSVAGFK